jgi:HD superfamily phosphohydrolase
VTTPDPRILAGQTIGGYVIVHSNGAKEPAGQPAEPLGAPEDTGVVYRAVFKDQQHRAVKFVNANRSSSKTKETVSHVSRGFYRERIFLTWLTHGNIVRFHDAGLHEMEPDDREYIVTEFISGEENFREELNSNDVSGEECYRLIGEVLRALIYMHSVGVGHGSVKFETIRCRMVGPERQAVLLDLASAQQFGDARGSIEASRIADALAQSEHAVYSRDGIINQGPADVVPFKADERITHPDTLAYLEQRGSSADPNDVFPYHDLHTIGVLLKDLLNPELTIRVKLQDHLLDSGLNSLDMIVKWLLLGPLDCPYKTMKQLYDDWDKLRHSYLAPAEVPELSIAAEFKYSMATPVGRVVITPRLSRLVEHVLFQRLRDMPQLELVNLRYPGATHTRQQHAVVRLRNTRYYLAHLLNGPFFRLMTNKAELQATLVLALLQGVGHYQLSHFFEDYAAEQRTRKRQGNLTGMWSQIDFDIPTDRDLFPSVFNWNNPGLLKGNYSEVIRQCCANNSRKLGMPQHETLADVTVKAFDEATRDAVTAIFDAAYRPAFAEAQSHFVLAAILKSEIDADKISYLLEDAVETGVHFGEGIDLDGLLGTLRAPSPCDIEEADGPILGITEKGLAAVESVLNVRNEMYERVYWHHSTRAIAAMIKYCITRLLASGRFDMPDFVKETFFMSSDAEALRALWDRYEKIRERQSVNPISNLLFGERGIYKPVHVLEADDDQNWSVEETAKMEDILADLIGRRIPSSDVRRGEVVIDVPIAERGMAQEGRESLYVYEENSYEAGRALGRFSASAVAKVRDVHRQRGRRCRVFVSRSLLSRAGSEAINEVITEWTRQGPSMYGRSWR